MLEKRLDNLKVFATLLVVLGHVGVFYSGLGVLDFPEQPGIKIMTWLVYSFHMPLFFFISGVIGFALFSQSILCGGTPRYFCRL